MLKKVERLSGRVVMQRTATPCTSVRFRSQPPLNDSNIMSAVASEEVRPGDS